MMGEFTQKGNVLYHHIFRWPRNGEAAIANVVRKVKKVTMLETGEELPFVQLPDTRVIVKGLPYLAPDMMATTLKYELSDEMLENIPDYGTL
jgi:alpha-L-fucosidase